MHKKVPRGGRLEVRSEVEEEKVTLDRPDSNNGRNRWQ